MNEYRHTNETVQIPLPREVVDLLDSFLTQVTSFRPGPWDTIATDEGERLMLQDLAAQMWQLGWREGHDTGAIGVRNVRDAQRQIAERDKTGE